MPNVNKAFNKGVQDLLGTEWGFDKGITYNPGYSQFKLNDKGLDAKGQINPLGLNYDLLLGPQSQLNISGNIDPLRAKYAAALREGGNYGINLSTPLGDGNLSFEANRDNGNRAYWLRYGVNF